MILFDCFESEKFGMNTKIRVAVLDDHQATIHGYRYLFEKTTDIELALELRFGEEMEAALATTPIDVLILDANVPTSATNPESYPVLYAIARLQEMYPSLTILVISMHTTPALIQAALAAGATGYILKDDVSANRELAALIRMMASGDTLVLSGEVREALYRLQSGIHETDLSPRELQAISLCAAYPDSSTASIARRMGIAHSTLRNMLSSAYLKLGVNNKSAAIMKVLQIGLVLSPPKSLKAVSDTE